MPSLKLNKSNIDKLQFSGEVTDYFDTDLKGFGLRLGKESKTFFARREISGKPARITIGKLGAWTPDLAREKARELILQMSQGVDPRAEVKRIKADTRTVRGAFDEYLGNRTLRPNTQENYERVRDIYLDSWAARPLGAITRQDVIDRHREITAANGPGQANLTMTIFRAVWNNVHAHLDQPPVCPTKALSVAREWHPEKRRTDRLKPAEFPAFVRALAFMRQAHHDAYLLALHTGMRSGEVSGLLWEHVDLPAGIIKAVDTKNGTDMVLPVCRTMRGMLERRAAAKGPFVFGGVGKGGHIILQAAHLQKLGFEGLTVHGLRRTFRYLCEALNFPQGTIKRLMNHSLMADVTDRYLELEVEELRPYVERIGAEIERLSTP